MAQYLLSLPDVASRGEPVFKSRITLLDDKRPDLSYVQRGVEEIAPYLQPGNIVILEATSPVAATEKICDWIQRARPDLSVPGMSGGEGEQLYIAHCPEWILPGEILQKLAQNERIIGGVDEASTAKVAELYGSFVAEEGFSATADLSRLVENSYRDVNIAFVNELSLICEKPHVDVWETNCLDNHHHRANILNPGIAVGGPYPYISVEPAFIVAIVYADSENTRLIRMGSNINDDKSYSVYEHPLAKGRCFTKPVWPARDSRSSPISTMREPGTAYWGAVCRLWHYAQELIATANLNKIMRKATRPCGRLLSSSIGRNLQFIALIFLIPLSTDSCHA